MQNSGRRQTGLHKPTLIFQKPACLLPKFKLEMLEFIYSNHMKMFLSHMFVFHYCQISPLIYYLLVWKRVIISQDSSLKNGLFRAIEKLHKSPQFCVNFVVVQSLNHVWLFATPWIAACQASLSFTISQSLLKLMSIKSVMSSNHLILCCPLLLLPWIFPSIRVFSNELTLHIKVAKVLEFQLQHQSFQWIFRTDFL